jgi:ABC-type proline/glycine betaine transport system substrate-binding protein
MSLDDTEEFLYAYQEDGKDPKELAAQWIKEHRSDIDSWLK